MDRSHLAPLAVAIGLAVSPLAQATNGYLSHGFGTQSKGMAGAGSALPQEAMIAASNVAGGVWVGRRLDVGVSLFSPSRSYTQRSSTNQFPPEDIAADRAPYWPVPVGSRPDFTGRVDSEGDLFFIPHFGYLHPVSAVGALGVAVYGNGGMNTTFSQSDTTRLPGTAAAAGLGTYGGAFADPPNGTAGVDLAQLAVNLNYSHLLTDDLSVGAGAILAYQRFKAKGLGAFGQLVADGTPDALTNRGRDSVFGWGLQVGGLWRVNEQFSIGAAYQTRIDFAAFDKYRDLFAEQGDLDAPAFLNLGLAFKPRADLTLAFDLQHIWYSDVKALGNAMTNPLLLCMQGQAQYCLGGNQGVGFGWQDMTVYKFGAQWEMQPDLALRAGYSYGKQPVPKDGVLFNVLAPAVIEHHFTAGLTKRLDPSKEISLAVMYAPRNDLDCGCRVPFSGGAESINIAMDQWEFEVSFGMRW